jgi:LysR family cyn operon transcriptional activator
MLPEVVAKNGFSLERLATLCAVIECGSITAAAGPSASRQSQFSRQIKELEEALGARLFDRVGKTLRPTLFGEQLARMSRTFFGAVAELAAQEAGKPEQIVIGGGEAILRWVLLPCLPALRDLEPPIYCEVRSLPTAEVVREVELGRLHFGLVRRDAVSEGLASKVIGTLQFALVVPRVLLRGGSAEVIFEGRALAYAELSGGGQLATLARETAKEAGIRLNRVLQAETLSLLLAAVEHGDAAAFLPLPAVSDLPQDRFAIVKVENIQRLNREMVLMWSPEATDHQPGLKRALLLLSRSLRQAMSEAGEGAKWLQR